MENSTLIRVRTAWFLIALVALIFTASSARLAFCQDSESDRAVVDLDPQVVPMIEYEGIGHSGTLRLEGVQPDRRYRCAVTLDNQSDAPFDFSLIRTGCSCSKFELKSRSIGTKESGVAILDFSTPKGTADGKFGFRIDFFDGVESTAGVLQVSMNLEGNLFIAPQQAVYRVGKGVSVWKIPISFTPPVRRENLEIELSESFRDFASAIIAERGKNLLTLSLPEEQFDSQYLFGAAVVRDKIVGSVAEVDLMFSKKQPVVFSPRVLRFRNKKSIDGKPSGFVARMILQIDPELLNVSSPELADRSVVADESIQDAGLRVQCSVAGIELPINIEKMSNRIFRIVVSLPIDEEVREKIVVEEILVWNISANSNPFVVTSPFIVEGIDDE
jgi:hypothetical protein